jgi:hypothetical protein
MTTNARVGADALKCVEKRTRLTLLKTDDKIDARGDETTTNTVF